MQIQKLNLDGSIVSTSELENPGPDDSWQFAVGVCVKASAETPGFYAIVGENLLAEAPTRVFHVVASQGVLIADNLTDVNHLPRRGE